MPSDLPLISSLIQPLILEIYLNNSIYKERLLINDLKRSTRIIGFPEDSSNSFFVKAEEFQETLYTVFGKEILNFRSTSDSQIGSSASSIFFLDGILQTYRELRYFRVNVSNTEKYSRVKDDMLVFDYRLMHVKVDIANRCSERFIKEIKRIFSEINIYRNEIFFDKPYFEIDGSILFDKLYQYEKDFDEDEEEHSLIQNILDLFGPRIERDNSIILIIMES
tara:strand:+ start:11752 stop:12417 length:666 start_codon:yes stop_codon:yes gene_type:complete